MPGLFEGASVLVTGAGRGIGAAAAQRFAAEGARVVLTSRSEDELQSVVAAIVDAGGTASHVAADVSDHDEVDRVVETVVERHGRLDVAFNNAGAPGTYQDFVDIDDADLDRIFDVNVKSVWWFIAAEVRAMRQHGDGGAMSTTRASAAGGGTR